ncbi:hypothetical protein BC628DRAFT_861696 [Trametes gibbosa]|nr:hypothetical protein BC628DRAFT_861696 [Trametes gibbosa]
MMKSAVVLAALATLAAAQSVFISAPQPQTTLSAGETFIVDITRVPNFIISSDVSVAVGLASAVSPMVDENGIGSVLFAGPYNPQGTAGVAGVSENYTVTVPDGFPKGNATLSVAHFFMLGTSVSVCGLCVVRGRLG